MTRCVCTHVESLHRGRCWAMAVDGVGTDQCDCPEFREAPAETPDEGGSKLDKMRLTRAVEDVRRKNGRQTDRTDLEAMLAELAGRRRGCLCATV